MTVAWSDQSAGRPDWRLIAELIQRHSHKSPRVLDVGCYTGGLLKMLDENVKKAGVEPNRAAANQAALRARAEVWHSLADVPAGRQFDFIIVTDVLEHVDSPGILIKTLFARLAPRGAVIVTTGNGDALLARLFGANWWYWFYVEHISFISPRWLKQFCGITGANASNISYFAYQQLSPLARLGHFLQTLAYGVTGVAYLEAVRLAHRLTKRQ